VKALSYLMDGGAPIALNLGGGTGTTVNEIIEAVERVAGVKLTRTVAPRREGDPGALVACADGAAAVLDWKPSRSDLETIIRTAWRWHAEGG
jgi:UDP-arabinose 4-epimerase